jgi:hypothetical protein
MKLVQITKNAKLKKDADGEYWLLIESSAGPAMFNLSSINTNPVTGEEIQIGFDEVLEAFMNEQQTPVVDSQN